jgi:hypothetical protein
MTLAVLREVRRQAELVDRRVGTQRPLVAGLLADVGLPDAGGDEVDERFGFRRRLGARDDEAERRRALRRVGRKVRREVDRAAVRGCGHRALRAGRPRLGRRRRPAQLQDLLGIEPQLGDVAALRGLRRELLDLGCGARLRRRAGVALARLDGEAGEVGAPCVVEGRVRCVGRGERPQVGDDLRAQVGAVPLRAGQEVEARRERVDGDADAVVDQCAEVAQGGALVLRVAEALDLRRQLVDPRPVLQQRRRAALLDGPFDVPLDAAQPVVLAA